MVEKIAIKTNLWLTKMFNIRATHFKGGFITNIFFYQNK